MIIYRRLSERNEGMNGIGYILGDFVVSHGGLESDDWAILSVLIHHSNFIIS